MRSLYEIKVDQGDWKPFQTGIVLATQTSLDLQKEYLQDHGFQVGGDFVDDQAYLIKYAKEIAAEAEDVLNDDKAITIMF